ncbi:hypothetical protein DO97_04455 [Neosynechococcus sphagnicola sy1]|uniref:Type II secretion system protein n=1 Tax=Neosynechococcus sphagnicola sy1 TaxID=1497020 RepID=A0A098TQ40_9CYAN|nr:prepilin-type N-terminal cleavage/methylation domain-containing protein [Neosynechococcus sphagnicola]KGF72943.1 hypothetical protein DO97_04455 [Neosynechococcus sphagnicola sy1]
MQRIPSRRSEAGFTLIEALIATFILGIVGLTLFPAIAMTVMTRGQNQKAELALQVAQGEVNRIRLLVERGDLTYSELNPQLPPIASQTTPQSVPAPSGTTSTLTYLDTTCLPASTSTSWCMVKHPVSGDIVLGIQTFRVNTVTDSVTSLPMSMSIGVRVYDINALKAGTLESPPVANATLGLSTNQSRIEPGSGGRRPLITLYAPIVRSDFPGNNDTLSPRYSSLKNYCDLEKQRLGLTFTCPTK